MKTEDNIIQYGHKSYLQITLHAKKKCFELIFVSLKFHKKYIRNYQKYWIVNRPHKPPKLGSSETDIYKNKDIQ